MEVLFQALACLESDSWFMRMVSIDLSDVFAGILGQ
jgi:hypothetical protein